MYVQPIYQYGSLLYGTASRIHLGAHQRQQNYLVRIIFVLKGTDEVRTYRKNFCFLSIFEFHVYELFKLLCKIVRREHHSSFVNNFISTSEINKCVYDERKPKSLITKYKMTTANKKRPKHGNVYYSAQSLISTNRFCEKLLVLKTAN